MQRITSIVGSRWFFWTLIVVGSAAFLSIEIYTEGLTQDILYFLTLFLFVFGVLRNAQIRKACACGTSKKDDTKDNHASS